MYVKLYVYYNKRMTDIRIYDEWKLIQPLTKNIEKEYTYKRIKRITDLFILLGEKAKYDKLKIITSNHSYFKYLNMEDKEEFKYIMSEGISMYRNGTKLSRDNTIDAFIKGCTFDGYPVYTMHIDETSTPYNYTNVITDSPYIDLEYNKSIIGELHAILRLIELSIKERKKLCIYYSNDEITDIIDINKPLTKHVDIGNEFRNQLRQLAEKMKEINLNINKHGNKLNVEFNNLNEFDSVDYVIDNIKKILNNNLNKLENEVFNKDKMNRHGLSVYRKLTDMVSTKIYTRKRSFIISGIKNRKIRFIFSGKMLYVYYKEDDFKITYDDLLMLIVFCPDIQSMINDRLQDYYINNEKLQPNMVIINELETDYNIDFLTKMVLEKAPFLITSNYGLTRHNVINITEAISILNNTKDDYSMRYLTPLLMTVPRTNQFFREMNPDSYTSINIPICIEKNQYNIKSKNDEFSKSNNHSSIWYKLYIYPLEEKQD